MQVSVGGLAVGRRRWESQAEPTISDGRASPLGRDVPIEEIAASVEAERSRRPQRPDVLVAGARMSPAEHEQYLLDDLRRKTGRPSLLYSRPAPRTRAMSAVPAAAVASPRERRSRSAARPPSAGDDDGSEPPRLAQLAPRECEHCLSVFEPSREAQTYCLRGECRRARDRAKKAAQRQRDRVVRRVGWEDRLARVVESATEQLVDDGVLDLREVLDLRKALDLDRPRLLALVVAEAQRRRAAGLPVPAAVAAALPEAA